MAYVITFRNYRPPRRYDSLPWTDARIEEAPDEDGPWAVLETIALSPVDADPENPAARDFTTELGTAAEQWYRVVFVDANGDEAQPTTAEQNAAAANTYATVDELARILKIRDPSDDQRTALERVLVVAAGEIDAEIDLESDSELSGWQLYLATEVNLERAVEHWKQQEAAFGVIDLGVAGSSFTARDSWERHAHKLAPIKDQWGLA